MAKFGDFTLYLDFLGATTGNCTPSAGGPVGYSHVAQDTETWARGSLIA